MAQFRISLPKHAGNYLWLLVAIAVTAKILVKGGDRSVYPIFATAAHNWWAAISMYQEVGESDLYRYSPTFSVFFTPFAIHETLGHIMWVLASMALLYFACRAFYGALLKPQLRVETDKTLSLFLLLIALTFVRSVWQGQSNILLIALVLFGLVALYRDQSWRAAFFLTAAAFIKIWPLALIMLLSVKHLKLIPRCLVAAALLAAIPFLTQPTGIVMDQYAAWGMSLVEDQGRRTSYRDFWTIWELFFSTVNPLIYRFAQLTGAFVVFVMTVVVIKQDRAESQKIFLVLSLWVCWQLQIGPGTERMTYSIFAPIIASALIMFRGRDYWLLIISYVLLGIFTHGSLERLVLEVFPVAEMLIVLAVTTYFLWLTWQLVKHPANGRHVGQ